MPATSRPDPRPSAVSKVRDTRRIPLSTLAGRDNPKSAEKRSEGEFNSSI